MVWFNFVRSGSLSIEIYSYLEIIESKGAIKNEIDFGNICSDNREIFFISTNIMESIVAII